MAEAPCSIVPRPQFTVRLSKFAKVQQAAALAAADNTANAIREAVDGVKVVKMLVWEEAYAKYIRQRRATELVYVRRFRILTICVVALGRASPVIACLITFVLFGYLGRTPTAS
jgi:hypothetical protein